MVSDEDSTADSIGQFTVRFPQTLIDAMDQRAATTNRSRAAWLQRVVSYVLSELPPDSTPTQRTELRKRWQSADI
jgi:hypothetical protein